VNDLATRLRAIGLPDEVLQQLELREDVGAAAKAAIREARESQAESRPARKPSRDQRLEAEIRMEIRRWCEARGAALIIDNEQNRPTRVTEGLSDLIVLWGDSRGITYVECKSATGKQTMAQRRFQVAVEASGGRYVLARGTEDMEARL
jgi:hypothetical protein